MSTRSWCIAAFTACLISFACGLYLTITWVTDLAGVAGIIIMAVNAVLIGINYRTTWRML